VPEAFVLETQEFRVSVDAFHDLMDGEAQ